MNRNIFRLTFALAISSAGFAGSALWYHANDAVDSAKQNAVATIGDVSNEVQRKPVKRVIWETVGRNEELYAGEAIRTAANAEAQILVTKSGTKIRLEPDSLIVLEENDKGLSLDFLQGNLQVAGQGALTVKTSSGEIKMDSAELSLSKDQSGQVSVEMFKGQAELQQGSQKVAIDKNKAATLSDKGVSVAKEKLDVLAPQPGESVLLNLARGDQLQVRWKALNKGYTVHLESGRLRHQMGRVASVAGEKGVISLPVKPGKQFLRLQIEASQSDLPILGAVTLPFTVEPKTPPSLLEPVAQAVIFKREAQQPVALSWLNRHEFQAQVIEIAKDVQFKQIHLKHDLNGQSNQWSTPLADGAYFWRVTGYLAVNGKSEGLSSRAQSFVVKSKFEVVPPVLTTPASKNSAS